MAVQTIGEAGSGRFHAAAERIDYWIRRHAIPLYCGNHPAQTNRNSPRDRLVGLAAIGQSLKERYDACATPVPPHLVELVAQLKTQK